MGFSLTAAFSIIGIAILISIELLSGALFPAITDVDESYQDMIDRSVERVLTSINVTDVSTFPFGANYSHNITVENGGSTTLKTNYFSILINGTSYQFTCTDSYIYPKQEVQFNISNVPGTGNKLLKVIAENGISAYYQFTV